MENNQFRKMLFESQNSFDKQIKGMKPLNEDNKMLFKDKYDNKIYLLDNLVEINDWNSSIEINDYVFQIGYSSKEKDNYVTFPNGINYTLSEIKKSSRISISDEVLKEAFMMIIDNFKSIVIQLHKNIDYESLIK